MEQEYFSTSSKELDQLEQPTDAAENTAATLALVVDFDHKEREAQRRYNMIQWFVWTIGLAVFLYLEMYTAATAWGAVVGTAMVVDRLLTLNGGGPSNRAPPKA